MLVALLAVFAHAEPAATAHDARAIVVTGVVHAPAIEVVVSRETLPAPANSALEASFLQRIADATERPPLDAERAPQVR